MPSKSKAQQRFMGMVHALNKGEMKPSDASPAVKKAAKSMDKSDAKKYASTTHKGKPEKVKKEAIDKIREMIRMELESCGYTTSAVDPNIKLKSPGGTGEEDRDLKDLKEGEKEKIVQLLVKRGNTEQDAQNMVNKSYDYIKKAYRKTTPAKKAEIMSYLSKYESTEQWGNLVEKCWKGYEKQGTKKMFGKTYPNCVKKESVNEEVNPRVKKQATALLKRYERNWKKLEKETEMMLKFAKKNKAREMAFNFEEVLKKLKGNVWSYISFQMKEPMDDYFYESVSSVNESQPFADFPKFPKLSRDQQESLDELFGFAETYQIFNSFNNNPKKFIKTLDDMAKIRKASKRQPKGVNFNKSKKQFVKEGILNEMDYRGFVKYMNDFYGPKGVYPDKKKRTLKSKDIGMAYSILLKKKPNFEIGFDSTDREMIRDILMKLRKLDPTYDKGQLTKDARYRKGYKIKEADFPIIEGGGVEKIMKMANDNSFGKLGGRTVDAMTANLFKQVYDKAPDKAKDKINKMNEKQLYVFMGKLWSKFGKQVRLR